MKKLIAIDGNSLLHRAFHALPPMMTKDGTPTGAIYGFMSMLLKLVDMQPDYMLVAFDMKTPTFRHERYIEYKAGRVATPDDLRAQFPILKELLSNMGVFICECERYEADDILGTYARIANEHDVFALLVTGDRDALQLISENTHVLVTKKGLSETVEFDEAELKQQYGLTPKQMPDLKGLMGDSSDNLPGIPGVGEKTAQKLLEKYQTLENTLANADNEKGALVLKIKNGTDSARMTYELGLINTHAPISTGLEDAAFDASLLSNGLVMLGRLELRNIISRLPQSDAAAVFKSTEAQYTPAKRVTVSDEAALNALVSKLEQAKLVALDIGDRFYIAADEKEEYEIVLGATLFETGLDAQAVFTALDKILRSDKIGKLVFDAKRVMHLCAKFGAELTCTKFDAMIADYLINAIHPADLLDALILEQLGIKADGAAPLFVLYNRLTAELDAKGLISVYKDIELPLTGVLYDMEQRGFMVDAVTLEELSADFGRQMSSLSDSIYSMAGEKFNILSPKQLSVILFEKLKLTPQKKNKSGYSTDAAVLEKLSMEHDIVPLILDYRFVSKLKSTFVDAMLTLARQDDDSRIHSTFNQNVTATGRISSTEPNLQNIPVRTEVGREIRRAFVAKEGCVLVDADYSQIELRLLAHISGDERMIAAFNSGADIHASTAAEVFGTSLDKVTKEQRSAAKAVNFGIVYGISAFGLANNIHTSPKEAASFIERYLERYEGIRNYMKQSVERGKKLGYASTMYGRRRDLPELSSSNFNMRSFGERVAMNMPIQGTAADIIKLAMVNVDAALKKEKLKSRLILQVHDELIIEAPQAEAERVKVLLKECMEGVAELKVKLLADVHCAKNWNEAK